MGRLQLAVGTRYERDGRTFVVLQVLRDGRLVVEDQSGGGQGVVTRDEVTAAWERGALRFAVRGPGARARGGGGVGHGVHDRRCPPGGGGGAVSGEPWPGGERAGPVADATSPSPRWGREHAPSRRRRSPR